MERNKGKTTPESRAHIHSHGIDSLHDHLGASIRTEDLGRQRQLPPRIIVSGPFLQTVGRFPGQSPTRFRLHLDSAQQVGKRLS